jgi:hypothetical protein
MADNYPTFNALAPTLKAPPRNAMLGLLADALSSANAYATKANPAMPGGVANPPLNTLAGLLGLGGVARTVDRMSYGEPLTNAGKANVPYLPADTVDAISAALGLAPAASRAALKVSDKAVQAITRNPQATATAAIDYGRQMVPANPVAVWHGTPTPGFESFNLDNFGKTDGGWLGKGIYGAESPMDASAYASLAGKPHGAVYRVDLDVNRPLVIDWDAANRSELLAKRRELGAEKFSEWLKDSGYDGVQFLGPKNALNSAGHRDIQWMALRPEQAKIVDVSFGR